MKRNSKINCENNKINLLFSGPIRPNAQYIVDSLKNIKTGLKEFEEIKSYICYWKTNDLDFKLLNKNFDNVICVDEPDDNKIFSIITSRTGQQKHLEGKIEHWTPRIYKMYLGIRKLVDNINIDGDQFVFRIRTDLNIEYKNIKLFTKIVKSLSEKNFLICPRIYGGNCCDWFSVSYFSDFKKIYYFENDKIYNQEICKMWCAENVILQNSRKHKIRLVNINNLLQLSLCREYNIDTKEKKLQFCK